MTNAMKKVLFSLISLLLFSVQGNANFTEREYDDFPTIYSAYYDYYDAYFFDCHKQAEPRFLQKNWRMYYDYSEGNCLIRNYYIEQGDSTVEGKAYARVIVEGKDILCYRQEGDRVFCLDYNGIEEQLLLDYGLQTGDTFVNPMGIVFTVVETDFFNRYEKNIWYYGRNREPKTLRLVSTDGEEDIWVEGIGSLFWGILPPYLAKDLPSFPSTPAKSKVIYAPGIHMAGLFEVAEDDYKLVYAEPEDIDLPGFEDSEEYTEYLAGRTWTFCFTDDTLIVSGIMTLNCLDTYVATLIREGNIDVNIGQLNPMGDIPACGKLKRIHAKIPGFKPGTYHIGDLELVCKGALADYHPFIEEGKEWVCTTYTMLPPASEDETEPNYRITEETYTIGKDTLIQGRTCIGMERDRFQKRYFYEDGDKVYCYNTENERFYLIYDFGCQVGDRFTVVDAFSGTMRWWDENFFTCSVRDVDTVKTKDGMELRRITLEAEDVLGEHTTETWIEGIGSVYGPLHNVGAMLYIGGHEELDSCEVSNQLLYPLSQSTGIHTTNLTPQTESQAPLYDLSGRRIVIPRRGLYIKDGKKVSIR